MKGTLLIDELQNYVELVIIFAFIIRVEWDQMLIVLHVQMNGSLLTRHHLLSQVSYPDTIQNDRKLGTNPRPAFASKTINCCSLHLTSLYLFL